MGRSHRHLVPSRTEVIDASRPEGSSVHASTNQTATSILLDRLDGTRPRRRSIHLLVCRVDRYMPRPPCGRFPSTQTPKCRMGAIVRPIAREAGRPANHACIYAPNVANYGTYSRTYVLSRDIYTCDGDGAGWSERRRSCRLCMGVSCWLVPNAC